MTRKQHRETGMSLVEVIAALAIMGSVLISVASLFVLGGQRVKGSRNTTQGMAVATDVLEELYDIGINTLPDSFSDCCGGAACGTVTGCTVSSDSDPYLQANWLPLITREFAQGRLEITLQPIGGGVTPATFDSAEGIRVHIEVLWYEGTSQRSAIQETILF